MKNTDSPVAYIRQRFPTSHAASPVRSDTTSQTIAWVVALKPTATLAGMTVGSAHVADSDSIRSIVDLVLPPIDEIVAGVPADLVESDEELRARIRLTYANARVLATAGDLDEAIGLLRARASGRPGVRSVDPFGRRFDADTFERLADQAEEALTAGRLDLSTVLSLMYQSGRIAAQHGRRLILFLALNAHIRRQSGNTAAVDFDDRAAAAIDWSSSDGGCSCRPSCHRWQRARAIERPSGSSSPGTPPPIEPPSTSCSRPSPRLPARYYGFGGCPSAMAWTRTPSIRVAAILPGPNADPTPEEPGIDEADLEKLAGRIDQLLRRRTTRAQAASGIRVPLAITWRGSIVAILGPSPQEWQRLQDAIGPCLGGATGGATNPGRRSL